MSLGDKNCLFASTLAKFSWEICPQTLLDTAWNIYWLCPHHLKVACYIPVATTALSYYTGVTLKCHLTVRLQPVYSSCCRKPALKWPGFHLKSGARAVYPSHTSRKNLSTVALCGVSLLLHQNWGWSELGTSLSHAFGAAECRMVTVLALLIYLVYSDQSDDSNQETWWLFPVCAKATSCWLGSVALQQTNQNHRKHSNCHHGYMFYAASLQTIWICNCYYLEALC